MANPTQPFGFTHLGWSIVFVHALLDLQLFETKKEKEEDSDATMMF